MATDARHAIAQAANQGADLIVAAVGAAKWAIQTARRLGLPDVEVASAAGRMAILGAGRVSRPTAARVRAGLEVAPYGVDLSLPDVTDID